MVTQYLQVREVPRCHAKIRSGAFRPFLLDGCAILTTYIDLSDPSGNGIEAGSEDDQVKLPLFTIGSHDAIRGECFDGVLLDLDDIDFFVVEGLKVGLLQTYSLRTIGMGRYCGC